MSDNGEPQMSSVITARLENIDGDTLEIQVLCMFTNLLLALYNILYSLLQFKH